MKTNLSPLAVLVLSILSEKPAHSYEILSTLRERGEGRFVKISPGSVYRAVERLESEGLAVAVGTDRSGNRPERTTYQVTPGWAEELRQHVAEFVAKPVFEPDRFTLGLVLLNDVELDVAVSVLTERRDRFRAHCEERSVLLTSLLEAGMPRRFVLDHMYEQHQLAAQLEWINQLIEDLQNGTIKWDEPVSSNFAALFPMGKGERP